MPTFFNFQISYMQQATRGLVLQWFYAKLNTQSSYNNGKMVLVLEWVQCDVLTLSVLSSLRNLRQIFQSLPPFIDILLLLLFFMVIFAILGFCLFSANTADPVSTSITHSPLCSLSRTNKHTHKLIDSFLCLYSISAHSKTALWVCLSFWPLQSKYVPSLWCTHPTYDYVTLSLSGVVSCLPVTAVVIQMLSVQTPWGGTGGFLWSSVIIMPLSKELNPRSL